MLILSQRLDERILIGDNVVVTICKIEHGKVRVGIEARAKFGSSAGKLRA